MILNAKIMHLKVYRKMNQNKNSHKNSNRITMNMNAFKNNPTTIQL